MAMINSNDFKNGIAIIIDGEIFRILEFMHVKPGKGNTFIRTKLRNLRSGAVIDKRIDAGIKIEQATVEKKEMQYLYSDGINSVFMDTENYEQVEISEKQLEYEKNFLIESMVVNILFYGSEVLGVELPDKVTLEVVECVPGVKGDTKTSATKDAKLETGLVIQVPLFIMQGEKIIVNTQTGEYSSREK